MTSDFVGCDGTCAGTTRGELYATVTVTEAATCTPTPPDVPGGMPEWIGESNTTQGDGGVYWDLTCCDEAPPPDAGSCALVGSAPECQVLWAPCPPDGGRLCEWWNADGGMFVAPCAPGVDAGPSGAASEGASSEGASSEGASSRDDVGRGVPQQSGGDAGPGVGANGEAPSSPDPTSGSAGCSVAEGGAGSLAPLFAWLALFGAYRLKRRRRAAPPAEA